MPKYYFISDYDETCYTAKGVLEYMEENGLTELTVNIAEIEKVEGYFYCLDIMDMGEKGDCGKYCSGYSPRNGKSGICKWHRNFHEPTDKTRLFKLKNK